MKATASTAAPAYTMACGKAGSGAASPSMYLPTGSEEALRCGRKTRHRQRISPVSGRMRDEALSCAGTLVLDALLMAVWRRKPGKG